MKIAFLISHVPDPRLIRRISFLATEYSVSVLYFDRENREEKAPVAAAGVEFVRIAPRRVSGRLGGRLLRTLVYYLRVLPLLIRMRPVAVHCANLDMLFLGVLYQKWFNSRVRVIYEVADLHPLIYNENDGWKGLVRRFFCSIERRLCANCDLLIVTSPVFVDSHFGSFVDKDKVLFQPNTPERHVFEGFRKRERTTGLTIGAIGTVRYAEQLRMLVDVSERIEGIDVLIAGEGPDSESIRAYCKNKTHVRFYGGYDYNREIKHLYEQVDCVYAVYDTEIPNVRVALPNRLYEAIVCELPIIVAEGTVLAQFCLEHGVGYSVSDREPEQLEQLLQRLLDDPRVLEEAAKRARELRELYFADSARTELLARYRVLVPPACEG